MTYKDKDKQKQAVREATRRYRLKGRDSLNMKQGITSKVSQGITDRVSQVSPKQGITVTDEPPAVIPVTEQAIEHSCQACPMINYIPTEGLACPSGKWPTSVTSIFEQNINPDSTCQRARL